MASVPVHLTPFSRNVEMLIQLIALGELPAEAQPPENLLDNPSSVYNAWLNDLPQHIRDLVLSRVPECDIKKQFLKVSEDGCGGGGHQK